MQQYPGRFIVLEGSDGSGKTTQFNLLAERLRAVGYEVEVFDFPRYDQPSSHFVRAYLNGDFGPAAKISPYAASIFYALDRYEAAPGIRRALEAGKIVLSNRYVGSNMGHQGAKFSDEAEQRGFFVWNDSFEFELLGIPRPDINLYLRVPPPITLRLIKERAKKTGVQPDQHEADKEHLAKAAAAYDSLCKLFPKDFVPVDCAKKGKLLTIPAINDKLWGILKTILPPPPHRGRGTVVKLTNLSGPPPAKTPAAPAGEQKTQTLRLSLQSLLGLLAKDQTGIRFELPESFSGKDGDYYLPAGLDSATSKQYRDGMRRLAELQRQMRSAVLEHLQKRKSSASQAVMKRLADNAVLPVVPLAALSKVESALSKAELSQDGSQAVGVQQLVKERLPGNLAAGGEELKLLDFWPRSEFSLLADGLYPYTDLSRQEILDGIDNWTYERKEKALRVILADRDSQVMDELKYRWDGLSAATLILKAWRRGLVKELRLQKPTVRFGYDMPALIEAAGQENRYLDCFDLSLALFSSLQAAGHADDASYAALLGHKLRWQFSLNSAKLNNFGESDSDYAVFIAMLKEKIAEVHPLIFQALNSRLPGVQPANPARNDDKTRQPAKKPRRRRL
ncbi:MAG TPA: thymidylate kinase [Candidatus Nitrosopolaris sp.]|nr:thymidylate kinase [Candidatus Nitrosopolaris sp.]